MKKLIGLIAVVAVIWIGLKMIGVDISLSPTSSQGDKDKGIYTLPQIIQEGNRPKDIVGMSLPKTAINGRGPAGYNFSPNTEEVFHVLSRA